MPDRRRPPMLSFSSATREKHSHLRPEVQQRLNNGSSFVQNALRLGFSGMEHGEEIRQCINSLRSDLETSVGNLEDQLERMIERQASEPRLERLRRMMDREPAKASSNPGWRSAPSEGRNSLSAQSLQDFECDSVSSETPTKLPPPPSPGTRIQPSPPSARLLNSSDRVLNWTSQNDDREDDITSLKLDENSATSTRTGSESMCAVEPFSAPRMDDEEDASEFASPTTAVVPKRLSGQWLKKRSRVAPSQPAVPEGHSAHDEDEDKTTTLHRNSTASIPNSERDRRSMAEQAFNFKQLSLRMREEELIKNSRIVRCTRSQPYEILSGVIIAMNALLIVWETDWRAQFTTQGSDEQYEGDYYFYFAANMFCIVFTLDLLVRACSERSMFLTSREWGWNAFDIFVCFTAVLEAVVQWVMVYGAVDSEVRIFLRKFSMLRILRLLRAVRVFRGFKFLKHIRELRVMVYSLTSSVRPLAWSAVLIIIILLVFAVFFTDGVTGYCQQYDLMNADSTKQMRRYFGRVPIATVSLFMSMTGGEDWGNIMITLKPLPFEYTLLFISFISFSVLALLNLVTAVFINTAMQRTRNDRELAVQQELENKEELVSIIQQVFLELDIDHSGSLSIDELEKHIEDEKIQAFLKSRQIDIGQVRTLFTLLDTDQTGDVSMDEFVQGILRLKGNATSMDLAVLTYQVEYVVEVLASLTGDTCARNSSTDTGAPRLPLVRRSFD